MKCKFCVHISASLLCCALGHPGRCCHAPDPSRSVHLHQWPLSHHNEVCREAACWGQSLHRQHPSWADEAGEGAACWVQLQKQLYGLGQDRGHLMMTCQWMLKPNNMWFFYTTPLCLSLLQPWSRTWRCGRRWKREQSTVRPAVWGQRLTWTPTMAAWETPPSTAARTQPTLAQETPTGMWLYSIISLNCGIYIHKIKRKA